MDGSRELRTVDEEGSVRFCDRLVGLEDFISPEMIEQVVLEAECAAPRACRLNPPVTLWLVLAMGIYTTFSIRSVFRNCRRFVKGEWIPTRSALCKARQRLGIRPLKWLFEKVVSLLCRPGIPAAFTPACG